MPRMNPGNDGPVDARRPEDRIIVTFQAKQPTPNFHVNRVGVPNMPTANAVAWTSQELRHAHNIPPGSQNLDRNGMIKVYFPAKLKPRSTQQNRPHGNEEWLSLHHYIRELTMATPDKARRAGVFLETLNGKADSYEVVIAGNSYKAGTDTPQLLSTLLQELGATQTDIPTRFRANIHPHNIKFKKNKVYTDWAPLENHGFTPEPAPVPEIILARIKARYRLRGNGHNNAHQLNLTLEYVVLPEDTHWNDQLQIRLDNPKVPTFELWRNRETIIWHEAYPNVPGVFTAKDPIPAVKEIGDTATDVNLCSEWHRRRVAFDIIVQANSGSTHHTLSEHFTWISGTANTGPSGELPTLFLPPIPDIPEDQSDSDNTDSSQPSDGEMDTNTSEDSSVDMELTTMDTQPAPEPSTSQQGAQPNEWLTFQSIKQEPAETSTVFHNSDKEQNIGRLSIKQEPTEAPNSTIKLKQQQHSSRKKGLRATALGKYDPGPDVQFPLLTQHLQDTIKGISDEEAATLARLTIAATTKNTTRTQQSVQRVILKLFPERPDIFINTQPGDQLKILARLVKANYKPSTVRAYMSAYDNLVIINGGTPQPKLPHQAKIMAGLKNLDHNPARRIANTGRKAYSLEILDLVARLGVHLMRTEKKWSAHRAALYRAAITTLFFGRLRSGEALNTNNHSFDVQAALLAGDIIINAEKQHALLLLRAAKYQEQQGALVIIPGSGKPNCPIAALLKYSKYRAKLTTNQNIPFFLTETRWEHGDSGATEEVGLYTTGKFRKDTEAIVRVLTHHYPKLKEVTDHLVTHSLRAGLPTELQETHLDPEVKQQLGRWHSTASAVYMKNLRDATNTAAAIEKTLLELAEKKTE